MPQSKKYVGVDGQCLVELRSDRQQTMVPPSIHPGGEQLEWDASDAPAKVDGQSLCDSVAALAAATVLTRSWPREAGSRQELALAVAGLLGYGGVPIELAQQIIGCAARFAGDEEWQKRQDAVQPTYEKLALDDPVTGGPTVETLLPCGDEIVPRLRGWLGLRAGESAESRVDSWLEAHANKDNADVQEILQPLSELQPLAYEQVREQVSKVASVRIGVLDEEVKKLRVTPAATNDLTPRLVPRLISVTRCLTPPRNQYQSEV